MTDRHPGSTSTIQSEELTKQLGRSGQENFVGPDLDAVPEMEGDVSVVGALTKTAKIGGILD